MVRLIEPPNLVSLKPIKYYLDLGFSIIFYTKVISQAWYVIGKIIECLMWDKSCPGALIFSTYLARSTISLSQQTFV